LKTEVYLTVNDSPVVLHRYKWFLAIGGMGSSLG